MDVQAQESKGAYTLTESLERSMRQELVYLVDKCVRREKPFEELVKRPPFDWFFKRLETTCLSQSEVNKLIEAFRAVARSTVADVYDNEYSCREAAERLAKFNINWSKAHPASVSYVDFASHFTPANVCKALKDPLLKAFSSYYLCRLPIKQKLKYISFARKIGFGKEYLIVFHPAQNKFSVYFGMVDPFFTISIGAFCGLNETSWFFRTEDEFADRIKSAVRAIDQLTPEIIRSIERAAK